MTMQSILYFKPYEKKFNQGANRRQAKGVKYADIQIMLRECYMNKFKKQRSNFEDFRKNEKVVLYTVKKN